MSLESGVPSTEQDKTFTLDFSLPFSEAIKDLRTKRGRKMVVGSDNYHVLYALFMGETIDDYHNPPVNDCGKRIYNIKSRISSLRNTYGIDICSKRSDAGNHVEYWIDRGDKDGK